MALHIIKSAKATVISDIEAIIQDDDHVLLTDDGCYLYTLAAKKFPHIKAMSDQMTNRGLANKASNLNIELISVVQWALLTRKHQQIITW